MKFMEYGCIYVLLSVIKGQKRNIAQDKPAYQSSLFDGSIGSPPDASKAVDGDTNTNFLGQSCSHTRINENNSWWEVDLQSTYAIKEVIVYNRKGFEYRLGNYTLSGGVPCNDTSTGKCYTECYHHQTADLIQYITVFNCTARYIRITTLLDDGVTLCEVQIFVDLQQDLVTASVAETTVKTTEVISPILITKLITSSESTTAKDMKVVSATILTKLSTLAVSEAPTTLDIQESTTAKGMEVVSATILTKLSTLAVSEAPTTLDIQESTAKGTDVARPRGAILCSLFYLSWLFYV